MGSLLQIAGLGCVIAGAALLAPAAGFLVGGVALVFIGLALESKGR